MLKKRKLLILCVIVGIIFVMTTNYLLKILVKESESEREVINNDVNRAIYEELHNLSPRYRRKQVYKNVNVETIINNKNLITNFENLWEISNTQLSQRQKGQFENAYLAEILWGLKHGKIIKADLYPKGTQLKLLLNLQGNQDAVFKPQWYTKEFIIEGEVYAGKDRFGSEIIAFYLSLILNFLFVPFSVMRTLSLSSDILPVATNRLLSTSFRYNNRTCIYGKCFYCKKENPFCEDNNLSVSGALIFNLNGSIKSHASPWRRTYKKNLTAPWENSDNYCEKVRKKITKQRLLDLIDASIFDFLIQNGDRHHYETLNGSLILLDNGKGLGNPYIHHLDILAPLYQCCRLRSNTLKKLQSVAGGTLKEVLMKMPDVDKLITEDHLNAIEERLVIVFATVEYCVKRERNNHD